MKLVEISLNLRGFELFYMVISEDAPVSDMAGYDGMRGHMLFKFSSNLHVLTRLLSIRATYAGMEWFGH